MEDILYNDIETRIKQRGLWFTTKNDPTWFEASEYYKLDEYGDPTDKTKEQIQKEVEDYIGDGAVDIKDAIEMWIDNAITEYKLGLSEYLKTQFKPKQVIDQIEAYETPASVDVTQPTDTQPNEEIKLESKEIKTEDVDDFYDDEDDEEVYEFEVTNGDKTYTIRKQDDGKWIDDDGNRYMGYLTPNDILHYYSGYHIVTESKKLTEALSMEYIYDMMGQAKSPFQVAGLVHAMGYVDGGVAGILSNQFTSMKKDGTPFEDIKDKLMDTINANIISDEKEKVVASKEIKTEDVKRRLKEENNKSQNIISDMITAEDFDENSNQGKIVLKTSELFNKLSDNGFDVQVSFDNGESQSAIILGQQGGKVMITITGADNPIKAFVSGNYALEQDTLNSLNSILNIINE